MFKKITTLWISLLSFSLIHLSSFVYANECNIADFDDLKDDGYEILEISSTESVDIDGWGYVNVFSSEICSISDNNQLRVDAKIHMSTGFDKKITLYYPNSNMTPMIEDVSSQGSFFVGQLSFNIEAGGPFIVAYKLSEK